MSEVLEDRIGSDRSAFMRLEFRLLGPVEVRLDGKPVVLGPAKRVAMMAGLLAEPNRPVPLGRLTEALWPGRVPRSAADYGSG